MLLDHRLEEQSLDGHRIHRTMVELTRKCNLRCIYCAVSSPNWQHKSMNLEEIPIDKIISDLKIIGSQQVVLHGHGETTIVPNWDKYASKLIESGFELVTCTNMAKTFTQYEIEVLSKFVSITVSIDTFDEKRFSDMRRGAQLPRLVYNMTRINAERTKNGTTGDWGFSSVIVKENLNDLMNLISAGLALGVKIFSFCNLTKIRDVQLTHLGELGPSEVWAAKEKLEQARDLCNRNGAYFDLKGGLVESLKQACGQ